MKNIKYSIYIPGGNDTALVYGLNYTKKQRKEINDIIMSKHPNIEQVGFLGPKQKPELQMAGGEFCGNATRSTASFYLEGKKGNIKILVNSNDYINAGVDERGQAWCEIPLCKEKDVIVQKEQGIYIVKLKGMTSVVIKSEKAKKFLLNRSKIKYSGMQLIKEYELENNDAVGVMFCEYINNVLKINPVVWVKSINTLFYETACGSGTTATAMVEAFEKNTNQEIDILQPSNSVITSKVDFDGINFKKAIIKGKVETNNKIYNLNI